MIFNDTERNSRLCSTYLEVISFSSTRNFHGKNLLNDPHFFRITHSMNLHYGDSIKDVSTCWRNLIKTIVNTKAFYKVWLPKFHGSDLVSHLSSIESIK